MTKIPRFKDRPGNSHPLGATINSRGVNFAIYSKRADLMELLLFESETSPEPFAVYFLTPEKNRSSTYWHIFLEGCKAGQVYAWRAHGVHDPDKGLCFDPEKILLDPYCRGIVGWDQYSREAASKKGDNSSKSLRSVVLDCDTYDWEDDRPPRIPYSQTIIYEMHVEGFTKHPSSLVSPEKRGTFSGLIERLPYLRDLGVTTLELMPVNAFDKYDAPEGMTNYWGYSPIGYFAPHIEYSSVKTPQGALDEFRDMVKACHMFGLEVILDVVFNHTTENDENGPTLSFKGLDNLTYYTIDDTGRSYKNFSGCGNALRAEHPIVGKLILDALRFWVSEMHVDGFRFDLGSVLSRDIFGAPSDRPPLLWSIESDSVLASTKLILEAWDPAGLYQVGWFVKRANRFSEWNGPFRDDIRRFVKGDSNSVKNLANRITGSCDIYGSHSRDPNRSINFISCHDGFTLNDLVSYNQKHNEANGQDNIDGNNDNASWNCGEEGKTDDQSIEKLRLRQIKNLLVLLMFSQGTPMLSMGDEIRRTTLGNNNPYCQDNELNWFNWKLVQENKELLFFVKALIAVSQEFGLHRQNYLFTVENNDNGDSGWSGNGNGKNSSIATVRFHGVNLNKPDYNPYSHSLALEVNEPDNGRHLYLAISSYWKDLDFALPAAPEGESWHKIIDTSLSYPDDIVNVSDAEAIESDTLKVPARSVCILANTKCFTSSKHDLKEWAREKLNDDRSLKITWTGINI